jgi:hypothetical protein
MDPETTTFARRRFLQYTGALGALAGLNRRVPASAVPVSLVPFACQCRARPRLYRSCSACRSPARRCGTPELGISRQRQ